MVGDKMGKKEEKEVALEKSKSKKSLIIGGVIVGILLIALICVYFIFVPKISLNGKDKVTIKINDKYVESGAKATTTFKDVTNDVKIKGSVNTEKPGKYEIEYIVKEGLFTKKVKRVVEVIDDIAPVIELTGSKETSICPNSEYTEEGYKATDNYDGDITNKVKKETKEDLIIYKVKDTSGNSATVERKVKKQDKEAPIITLKGNKTVYIKLNSKYNESGVTAKDNCDTDLTEKIKATGSINTSKTGTYKIVYEVTDSSGNTSKIERTVIVYDKKNTPTGINKTGTIYLTFDDGPSATITPKILKILKEKKVPATFFVINHSNNLNYLIKQEYDEGHTVALHSYTHNYKTIYSSSTAYFSDLQKISDKVKSITGEESKIIRFPGGGSNTISKKYNKGIMTYLTSEVINRGYHYFDWNVSSGDAGGSRNKTQVYNAVTKNLRHNRANVVLMHDFENNYKTLNALSDIIDYGHKNGYTFLAIDMTTPLVRHGVNN